MRSFESLTAREILALAISLEEEDERIYADYGEELKQDFPPPPPCSAPCVKRNPTIADASSSCTRPSSASTFPSSAAKT